MTQLIGKVVHTEGHYQVIVTNTPGEHSYKTYGIYNYGTEVIECLCSQLAKAKFLARVFNDDLENGFDIAGDEEVPGYSGALNG